MALKAGDKVKAMVPDHGWYAAEVISVSTAKARSKAPIKVRFDGYGPDDDAWLAEADIKAGKKAAAPKTAAKGNAKETGVEGVFVGDRLEADWEGKLHPAEVVQASPGKKAPLKVHWVGMEKDADCWLPLESIKPGSVKKLLLKAAKSQAEPKGQAKAKAEPKAAAAEVDLSKILAGTKLQAEYDGTFCPAEVVAVSTGKSRAKAPIKVHFVGYEEKDDSWMPLDKCKFKKLPKAAAPATEDKVKSNSTALDLSALKVGTKVQADFEKTMCPAEVVTVSTATSRAKAPIKVHYVGYGPETDAWLPVDKVKSKLIKAANPKAEAKAAPSGAAALTQGMRVQADYGGTMYAAEVVSVSTAKNRAKAPVKVHFVGQPDESDEWLPLDKLKSKALKAAAPPAALKPAAPASPLEVDEPDFRRKDARDPWWHVLVKGTKVTVVGADSKNYPCEVVQTSKSQERAKAPVKVKFIGHDGYDDWVPVDKIKSKLLTQAAPASAPAATGYKALAEGQKLQAEIDGKWYAAEVVTVSSSKQRAKAPVKVHFVGYGAEDDLWLGEDRLRSKALKAAPAAEAKTSAKGKGKAMAPPAALMNGSSWDYGSKGKSKGKDKSSDKGKGKGKSDGKAKGKDKGKGKAKGWY